MTVVFAAPLRVLGLQLPEPVFGLVLAFAWPIIRPSVLAPFVLLAYGLFTDLYWGATRRPAFGACPCWRPTPPC